MKLKQWLREYHQMTYAQYRALPDEERYDLEGSFQRFNRSSNQMARYESSRICGGIDREGGYTALHHRYW